MSRGRFTLGTLAGLTILWVVTIAIGSPSSLSPLEPTDSAHPSGFNGGATPRFTVEISPTSWRVLGGDTVDFRAVPSPILDGCWLLRVAYEWGLPSPFFGRLNTTAGATVRFFAADLSGSVALTLEARGTVDCGGWTSLVVAPARANLTVVGPLAPSPLQVVPNPALPAEPVTLSLNLSGGCGPYRVELAPGDGTQSTISVPAPGPVSVEHAYPAGTFLPTANVTDSLGHSVAVLRTTTVSVNRSIGVALVEAAPAGDVGIPLRLTASSFPPLPNASIAWWSEPTQFVRGSSIEENVSAVGPVWTIVGASDNRGNISVTGVAVPFGQPPSFSVAPGAPTAEVGRGFPLDLTISGGVPPYLITFPETIGALGHSDLLPAPGTYVLPITPVTTGDWLLTVRLTDAAGASIETSRGLIDVVSPPIVNVTTSLETTLGNRLSIATIVVDGAGPFTWWIGLAVPAQNASEFTGTLPTAGEFDWSGSVSAQGSAPLIVSVSDAAGGYTPFTTEVSTGTALSVNVSPKLENNGTQRGAVLTGSISGGVPPYSYALVLSDGESGYGNLTAPGTVAFRATPPSNATIEVSFAAVDSLGAHASATTVFESPGQKPGAVPPPTGREVPLSFGWWGALPILGIIVLIAAVLRRRSPRSSARPKEDPVSFVRSTVASMDGVERSTLFLLAEERGFQDSETEEGVRASVDEGSVRLEPTEDGGELLLPGIPSPRLGRRAPADP